MGFISKWNVNNEKELDTMFNSTGYKYEKDNHNGTVKYGYITYQIYVRDIKELSDIWPKTDEYMSNTPLLKINLYDKDGYTNFLTPSKNCSDKTKLFNSIINKSNWTNFLSYGGKTPNKITKQFIDNKIKDIIKFYSIYNSLVENTKESAEAYKTEQNKISEAQKNQKIFANKIKDNIERQLKFLQDFDE